MRLLPTALSLRGALARARRGMAAASLADEAHRLAAQYICLLLIMTMNYKCRGIINTHAAPIPHRRYTLNWGRWAQQGAAAIMHNCSIRNVHADVDRAVQCVHFVTQCRVTVTTI